MTNKIIKKRIKKAMAVGATCAVMLTGIGSSAGSFLNLEVPSMVMEASAISFSPRTTAPAKSNSYYYASNPFYKCGYGMPNCTTYAYGRAWEINGSKPNLSTGNAGAWYWYNKSKGYYSYGSTPKVGAIACWDRYDQNRGHVAVVEAVNGNTVTISESHYNGTNFDTRNINKNSSNYLTNMRFLGYIYVTPSITESRGTVSVRTGDRTPNWPSISSSKFMACYALSNSRYIRVYPNANLSTPESGRYVWGDSDELRVFKIAQNSRGQWYIYFSYPVGNTRRNAYAPLSVIAGVSKPTAIKTATGQITAYKKANTSSYFGYVSANDQILVCGTSGSFTRLVYPVTNSRNQIVSYKMAFVKTYDLNRKAR